MKNFKIIFITIIMFITSSCNKENNPEQNMDNLKLNEIKPDEVFIFKQKDNNIHFFTVSEDGQIIAVTDKTPLAKYNRNGVLIEEYENSGKIGNLYYENEKIYAFDYDLNKIISYDLKTNKKTELSDTFNFEILEIKDLFVIENIAYVFLAPLPEPENDEDYGFHFPESDENNYRSFGEILYEVDLSTGKTTDLGIKNIISVYKSTDNNLYYYCYENKNYKLYNLNLKTSEKKIISDMNDTGYVFVFIYEGNNFTYLTSSYELKNKKMSDNSIANLSLNINSGPGSHVWLYSGHLVFRSQKTEIGNEDIPYIFTFSINSLYIGYLYNEIDDKNIKNEDNHSNTLTISAVSPYYSIINTDYLRTVTGINGIVKDQVVNPDAFVTQVLAGDTDIDIYILDSGFNSTKRLIDMGFYTPMNESEFICDYIDGCFDYIKEHSQKGSDIWGIPLSTDIRGLLYVPENFERFGLTYSDVEYYDNYIETLEKFYDTGEDCNIFAENAAWLFGDLFNQYEITYNDYNNKQLNFKTDLFKNILTLLSGYNSDKGENHPLFRSRHIETYTNKNGLLEYSADDAQKVIFRYSDISQFIDGIINFKGKNSLKHWRAFPVPKISKEVNKNLISSNYAIINPNSQNKETATVYLEAFTKEPHRALALRNKNFTRKDIDSYKEAYDTDLLLFNDIYNIAIDGAIYEPHISSSFSFNDFQNRRLTLDETIDLLQREYEMVLNE